MSGAQNLLFTSYQLGLFKLKNRVVMAPLTRNRCPNNLPTDLVAKYYSQRIEAGLIITEGTSISASGLGYARMPGLYTPEHVRAWKNVTKCVHGVPAPTIIFVQLMHCGRVSHPANVPIAARIMAPSAIAHNGQIWTDQEGYQTCPVPGEMTENDILHVIKEYAKSAELAMRAGFDGVELHGANGYLIDQFLNIASNKRMDHWGGSIENRIRFTIEVVKAVAQKIDPVRVGIRLSPYGVFNSMVPCEHTENIYAQLTLELQKIGILYIHIVDHSSFGAPEVKETVKQKIRRNFNGAVILSGGYNLQRANADLAESKGDLVAFGRPFISNPKLVSKMKNNLPLTEADHDTFYTPGERGYTDYPTED